MTVGVPITTLSWVDLSKEPVILTHPDMGDRYFTFQLAAMTSDNFDFGGRRTAGSEAGHFAPRREVLRRPPL